MQDRPKTDVLYLMAATVTAATIFGTMFWALDGLERNARRSVRETLQTVLATTRESIGQWRETQVSAALHWAETPELVEATTALLALSRDAERLRESPAMAELRRAFDFLNRDRVYGGFYVIAPDGTNVASRGNGSLGATNRLLREQPGRLRRVRDGDAEMSAPITPDPPVEGPAGGRNEGGTSIFALAPIYDYEESVIAILALRIDPRLAFREIVRQSRIGETGALSLFDRDGRRLTGSESPDRARDPGLAGRPGLRATSVAARERAGVDLEGYRNHEGARVVGAWDWDEQHGLGYAAEMGVDQAFSGLHAARLTLLTAVGVTTLLLVALVAALATGRGRAVRLAETMTLTLRERSDALEREVAERRSAEEAARRSEAALAEAQRVAGIGSWEYDLITGRSVWSKEHYRLLGFEPGGLAPSFETAVSLVHPDDRREFLEHRCAALAGETSYDMEIRIIRADGEPRHIHARGVVVRGPDGEPRRVVGTSQDVTERNLAERARRDSEVQFRVVTDALPALVARVDANLHYRFVNQNHERWFGWPRDRLIGRHIREVYGAPAYENLRGYIDRVLSGQRVTVENRLIRTVQGTRVVRGELIPDLDGDTRVAGFFVLVVDVTELHEREIALGRSEARFRDFASLAADYFWQQDAAGRFVYVSDRFEECVGVSAEKIIGKTRADAVEAGYVDEPPKPLVEAMAARRPFRDLEVRVRHRHRGLAYIELSGRPIYDENGAFAGYRGVGIDVTAAREGDAERNRLEDRLRHAQRMESIGQLSGGIAHDFNNILASILGYADLARGRPGARADERLTRYLGEVRRAGARGRDLVQQMLAFSRGRPSTSATLPVGPIVHEAASLLEAALPASIELRTEVSDDVPSVVLDEVDLHQSVMNLCINARDAIEGAGSIRVAVAFRESVTGFCTSCRAPVGGDYVELEVRDTGGGIDREVMDRMFEPFFSTKGIGKGSGMGLATVHGIVHEAGGHVVVESAPGRGCSFRLLFPAAAPDSAATGKAEATAPAESPAAGPAEGPGGRIAVVDDEPALVRLVGEVLSTEGHEVAEFTSAEDALSAVRLDPGAFDLVVTDQTMPRMTGLELLGELREIRPDLPVVLCSGHTDVVNAANAGDHGLQGFFSKPIDASRFRAAIEQLLEGHRRAS